MCPTTANAQDRQPEPLRRHIGTRIRHWEQPPGSITPTIAYPSLGAPQTTQSLSRLRIRPLARRLGLHLLLRDGQVIRPVGRVPGQVRLAPFQPASRRPALLPTLRELAARLRRVVVVFNVRLALGDGVRCGACEEGCCTYEAVSVVVSEFALGPLCVELCVREGVWGLTHSGRLPLLFGVSIRRLSLGDCCSDA